MSSISARSLLLAAALLAPLPALAQDVPPVLRLPTRLVNELAGIVGSLPWSKVSVPMAELQACVAAQVPQHGATVNRGGCPGLRPAAQKAPSATKPKAK